MGKKLIKMDICSGGRREHLVFNLEIQGNKISKFAFLSSCRQGQKVLFAYLAPE